jgi:hypothetical protein
MERICHGLLIYRDSSFGMAIEESEFVSLQGQDIFSCNIQTGSGAHPATCKMCTGGPIGINRQALEADQSPPSGVKVKNGGAITHLLYIDKVVPVLN